MSQLQKAMEEYLAVRRALGFKLRDTGGALHNFVAFMDQAAAPIITTKLALQWAQQPAAAQPAQWATRLGMVRRFAQYLSATDPQTEIPPQGLLPYRFHRKPPYIYNHHQIMQLIKAAKNLPSTMGLRPYTYSTLLGLLAVTGMRISEATALNREDVDLAQGILTIRRPKFGKTRLVPIHPSTQEALQDYASRRDRLHPKLKTPSFLISDRGARLTDGNVRWTFNRLSRQTGLRVSETTGLRGQDIVLDHSAYVRCQGKGRKERCTPLSKETVSVLRSWLRERNPQPLAPLFPNARGGPLSRDGVEYLLVNHIATAGQQCPSLKKKHVSPHVLRHTAAMNLLQHDVDRSVIALWLGHETVETTQIYLHTNLELKEQALARTSSLGVSAGRYQPDDHLLAFLNGL